MLILDLQLFAEKTVTVDGVTFTIDESTGKSESVGGDDTFASGDAGFSPDDIDLDDLEVDEDDIAGDDQNDDSDASEAGDVQDDSDGGEEGAQDDSGGETGDQDAKQESTDQKKDNPIAKAVIAERRRLQERIKELERKAAATEKLMKLVGVQDMTELQQRLDAVEAARIAQQTGITQQQAAELLRQRREIEEQRREIRRLKYAQEVERLKKDPFFADIEDYREEFEEIAERTGQTLEEVYMAKRGRQRMKEYEREIEQRTLANREKRQKAKVDTTQNGEQIKREKIDLPPDARAVAEQAVKMGIFKDIAEYAKFFKKK